MGLTLPVRLADAWISGVIGRASKVEALPSGMGLKLRQRPAFRVHSFRKRRSRGGSPLAGLGRAQPCLLDGSTNPATGIALRPRRALRVPLPGLSLVAARVDVGLAPTMRCSRTIRRAGRGQMVWVGSDRSGRLASRGPVAIPPGCAGPRRPCASTPRPGCPGNPPPATGSRHGCERAARPARRPGASARGRRRTA